MAGYWPRSFFASLWTSTPSRSINSQRKNLTNIQPYILTEQAWSITHIYFNLTHAVSQTFFFAIGRLKLFSVPFLSFFSALLLSSLLAFHILSGCRKKLGVNYGQSLEMGPWSITGIMGHCTTIFAPKLITLFFNLLRQNAVDIQNNLCVDRSILALLSAYQEYLLTFKLMTSQAVQRARPLITHICVVGIQRVKQIVSRGWNPMAFSG